MMKDGMNLLLDGWFDLLNGQLSYDSKEVKVYPGDPSNADYDHHVILKGDNESDASNGNLFMTNSPVIVEIVTIHTLSIKKEIAYNIKNQITQLLFPTRQCGLVLTGMQVLNVRLESSIPLEDYDGTYKYHRLINKFYHLLNQK